MRQVFRKKFTVWFSASSSVQGIIEMSRLILKQYKRDENIHLPSEILLSLLAMFLADFFTSWKDC